MLLRPMIVPLAAAVALLAAPLHASDDYRTPAASIVDIVDAPPTPAVRIDPTGTSLLFVEQPSLPSIADLAQPLERLAGMRINPDTNGPYRTSFDSGISIRALAGGASRPVELPDDARIGSVAWSPDGERFAFTNTTKEGIELWVAGVKNAQARRVIGPELNGVGGASFHWLPDGRNIVARIVSADRGPRPDRSVVPTGPVIQETAAQVAAVRTYQDLLENEDDAALFEWLMASRIIRINVLNNARAELTTADLYTGMRPSPDGRFLLTKRIHRPFSYLVPGSSFPTTLEVRSVKDGTLVRTIADLPMRDDTPLHGVPVGPRSHRWDPTEDTAQLVWVEALDGGDPRNDVEHRDRVLMLEAPFVAEPVEVARCEHRYSRMQWMDDRDEVLLSEYDRDRRWTRTWMMTPGSTEAPRLLWDRSIHDRYGDPGRPMTRTNAGGHTVARVDGDDLLLSGRGASPDGDRPFLDRLNMTSFESRRIWRCQDDAYESVVDVLDDGAFVTRHETPQDPPNYWLRTEATPETHTVLTHFPDPAPQLRGIRQELVHYERADGVPLSATLYLPPDYEPGTRLPLVVWAYPREFTDVRVAGQVSGSPNRFTRIAGSSHLFLLLQGYAVMDRAAMPIVGDPESMNDSFLEQIVAAAQAAIQTADDLGVADPDRVGVGGHSYGAFMTANLLAHCDLFRAGIARSGAYNRTLTPFGFQSERRTLWESPETYFAISPFMHAHTLDEPILLVHGEADNNSGTFPIQSKRLFHALKGNGGSARLVMLPLESHGYRARESVLHVLAEMVEWFDTHVKYAATREPEPIEVGRANE